MIIKSTMSLSAIPLCFLNTSSNSDSTTSLGPSYFCQALGFNELDTSQIKEKLWMEILRNPWDLHRSHYYYYCICTEPWRIQNWMSYPKMKKKKKLLNWILNLNQIFLMAKWTLNDSWTVGFRAWDVWCVCMPAFSCGDGNIVNTNPARWVTVTPSLFSDKRQLPSLLNTALLKNAPEVCPDGEAVFPSISAPCQSCALKRRLFLKGPFTSMPSKVMLQCQTWRR